MIANKNVGVLLMIVIGSITMLFTAQILMTITGKNAPAILLFAAGMLAVALYLGVINYLRTHGLMKLIHVFIFDAFIGVFAGIFMYLIGQIFGFTGSTTGFDIGDTPLNAGSIVFGFGMGLTVMGYYNQRKKALENGPVIPPTK